MSHYLKFFLSRTISPEACKETLDKSLKKTIFASYSCHNTAAHKIAMIKPFSKILTEVPHYEVSFKLNKKVKVSAYAKYLAYFRPPRIPGSSL